MVEIDKKTEQQELINFLRRDLNLIPEDFAGYYAKGWFFLDTNKFKRVLIEELHKTFHDVWNNKNDLYILNFGREGSGKSLFSLWLAYELFKKDNREFNILENVVFDHPEWVLGQTALKKDILIYDEAEDTFNTMNFQTHEGREGMKIAIRNRAQNIINILNFPSLRYLHPYIREERMDLLFLNLNYVYYVGNERKRVFIKAVYDKEDAVRILTEMSKTTFIDKKRIFRVKRGGKNILRFKPKIAGVFLLDEEFENPEFVKILDFYEFKKSETMDFVKVETLINNVFKKERFYLLTKMIDKMPSFILLLFKTLYRMVFNYSLINYHYFFEINNSKNKKDFDVVTLKDNLYYIFPERFFLILFPKEIWHLVMEKLLHLKFFEKTPFLEFLRNKSEGAIWFFDRTVMLRKESIYPLRSVTSAEYNNITTLDKYLIIRLLNLGKIKEKKEIYEEMLKIKDDKKFILRKYFELENLLKDLFTEPERNNNYFDYVITEDRLKEAKEKYPDFQNVATYLVNLFNYNTQRGKGGYDNIRKIDENILRI